MMKRLLTYRLSMNALCIQAVFLCAALMISAMSTGDAAAQNRDALRYEDSDADGLNDVFRDADGDGSNDLTGIAYPHSFPFADSDGDGLNDVFRDADGDGLNDLSGAAASGYPALDANRDGYNDVTGERYGASSGIRSFVDENGDGIDDRETWAPVKSLLGKLAGDDDPDNRVVPETIEGTVPETFADDLSPKSFSADSKMDTFIDQNSDGINDGRTLNEHLNESFSNEDP